MTTTKKITKKKDLVLETKGEVWAYNEGFIQGYKMALTELKNRTIVSLKKYQNKFEKLTK